MDSPAPALPAGYDVLVDSAPGERGELERRWAEQWIGAAEALAAERRAALVTLTDEEAAATAVALLDLAASLPPGPARTTSGFTEQQALFHGHRQP